MAIAVDSTSQNWQGYGPSLTVAHSVAGTDRLLLGFTGGSSSTAATYNGESMSPLTSYVAGAGKKICVWYLLNPPVGDHNIVFTLSGSGSQSVGVGVSLTGVAQTSTFSDAASNRQEFQGSPIVTGSFTIPSGGMGFGAACNVGPDMVVVSPASEVILGDLSGVAKLGVAMTASGSSVSWTWSGGGNRDTAFSSFAIAPASAGGSSLALTGVASTAAVGSVAVQKSGSLALTGVQSSAAVGSVSPSTGGIVNLTGVSATAAVGNVAFAKSGSLALTGVAAACAVGSVAVAAGTSASFAVPAMENNTESLLLDVAMHWTWFPGWRVGASLSGITAVTGTGNTHASTGVLTLTGLPAGPGLAIVARRVTGPTDDDVYYAAGTAA